MTDQDLEMVKTRRELFARAETKTRFGQRGEAFDDVSSAIASYRQRLEQIAAIFQKPK